MLLLILGAAVRTVPYITTRSLWNDEAALAVNIVEHSYGKLTAPLDHHQAAPTGFLWSVKTSTVLFGSGERALRLESGRGNSRKTLRIVYFVALTIIAAMLAEPGIRSVRDIFRYTGDTHMRPVMEYLDKKVEPADRVYIVGITAENLYRSGNPIYGIGGNHRLAIARILA